MTTHMPFNFEAEAIALQRESFKRDKEWRDKDAYSTAEIKAKTAKESAEGKLTQTAGGVTQSVFSLLLSGNRKGLLPGIISVLTATFNYGGALQELATAQKDYKPFLPKKPEVGPAIEYAGSAPTSKDSPEQPFSRAPAAGPTIRAFGG